MLEAQLSASASITAPSSQTRRADAVDAANVSFYSSGLVVHVLLPSEQYNPSVKSCWSAACSLGVDDLLSQLQANEGAHIHGSVLRHDLPIALATHGTGPHERRVGLIVSPTQRGCAYPRDEPDIIRRSLGNLTCVGGAAGAAAFVNSVRIICGERASTPDAYDSMRCCYTSWEDSFRAKREAAADRSKCVRFSARAHNHVLVGYRMSGINAVFYKAYQGETIADKLVRQACVYARRLAAAISELRSIADDPHEGGTIFHIRLTMPVRREENSHCFRNATCASSQDDTFNIDRLSQLTVPSPVQPAEC